jgi:hypothetical protein
MLRAVCIAVILEFSTLVFSAIATVLIVSKIERILDSAAKAGGTARFLRKILTDE